MNTVSIQSSNLERIGYNSCAAVLEIQFRSGGVYQYFGVPGMVYLQLLRAVSPGSYFARSIRNHYSWRRVK